MLRLRPAYLVLKDLWVFEDFVWLLFTDMDGSMDIKRKIPMDDKLTVTFGCTVCRAKNGVYGVDDQLGGF